MQGCSIKKNILLYKKLIEQELINYFRLKFKNQKSELVNCKKFQRYLLLNIGIKKAIINRRLPF